MYKGNRIGSFSLTLCLKIASHILFIFLSTCQYEQSVNSLQKCLSQCKNRLNFLYFLSLSFSSLIIDRNFVTSLIFENKTGGNLNICNEVKINLCFKTRTGFQRVIEKETARLLHEDDRVCQFAKVFASLLCSIEFLKEMVFFVAED